VRFAHSSKRWRKEIAIQHDDSDAEPETHRFFSQPEGREVWTLIACARPCPKSRSKTPPTFCGTKSKKLITITPC